MLLCDICNTKLCRYTVVWMPHRSHDSNRVVPICFSCCDQVCLVFNGSLLSLIRSREIRGVDRLVSQ